MSKLWMKRRRALVIGAFEDLPEDAAAISEELYPEDHQAEASHSLVQSAELRGNLESKFAPGVSEPARERAMFKYCGAIASGLAPFSLFSVLAGGSDMTNKSSRIGSR